MNVHRYTVGTTPHRTLAQLTHHADHPLARKHAHVFSTRNVLGLCPGAKRRKPSGQHSTKAMLALACIAVRAASATAGASWWPQPALFSAAVPPPDYTSHHGVGSSADTGTTNGFCAVPETLATWNAQTQCNGAPQFLSAFCADHAVLRTADGVR
jgi:hypothetical protein